MPTQPSPTFVPNAVKPDPSCPTCGVVMERGFQIDRGHAGTISVTTWHAGTPDAPKKWSLDWIGAADVASSALKHPIPVTTYRCPRCGLLQSYALPRDAQPEI